MRWTDEGELVVTSMRSQIEPHLLSVENVVALIMARPSVPRMLAIDGLPCSGKTTLAARLASALSLPLLSLDEFVVPPAERPADIQPGFPFPFFRTDEISTVVQTLSLGAVAYFHPYDWETQRPTTERRELEVPLIVEGCSVLSEDLAPLFDLRIWMESDPRTLIPAQRARDGDRDAENWRTLYLPSVERYMHTEPRRRADVFVAGRGAELRP